jgi:hypothetical protein
MSTITPEAGLHYSSYPVVTLAKARELTGLDLVSAREINSNYGQSYHEMEGGSESKSHLSARDEGIKYFCSIGYHVFPEGVGVRGTYTLADFVAIREKRTVFVEVLSDTNVRKETLQKKAKLQNHGELCFILFSGTKRADEANLMAAKRAVESWADVLYCQLDGYASNEIEQTNRATIVYDTTRNRGIRLALAFERSGRKLAVSAKFLTHLYWNDNTRFSYHVLPPSYCYEVIFLDVFSELARLSGQKIKFTSSRRDITAFRAMRRKSGLKMIGSDGHVVASLKSEYRGAPVKKDYMWTHQPSSRDLPPDDIYGVFVLERLGPDGLRNLLKVMEEHGLTPEYDPVESEQSLQLLTRQRHAAAALPLGCTSAV